MKTSLANQLEDMKRLAEGEARDKVCAFDHTVELINYVRHFWWASLRGLRESLRS